MSGPYRPATCDTCDQPTETPCDDCKFCTECCWCEDNMDKFDCNEAKLREQIAQEIEANRGELTINDGSGRFIFVGYSSAINDRFAKIARGK